MGSEVFDTEWYRKRVADPISGAPVRFPGTGLGNVDLELDALWYGVAFENQRRKMQHDLFAVFGLIDVLAGREPRRLALELLDTTAWVRAFDVLWHPEDVPSHLDPSTAINFRLDVVRSLASLPRSHRAALLHALDGYGLEEIASLMDWLKTTEDERVPNVESAERVVRSASSKVRGHCSVGIRDEPKPPKPVPGYANFTAGTYVVEIISLVEKEIEMVRASRREELRRVA